MADGTGRLAGDKGHRWLGYHPVIAGEFIAVCSCGWRSPAQRTAGVAGALLDAHRNEARDSAPEGRNDGPACASPGPRAGSPEAGGD